MKKLLLSFFLIGLVYNASAQAPITSAINPSAGLNLFTKTAVSTGVVPGPSGNQDWDFTLNITGLLSPAAYLDASGTTYASAFPTANVALNAGGGSFAYFFVDNTKYDFLGIGTAAYNVIYDDPETYFTYPMAYNVEQIDNFTASYTYGVFPDTLTNHMYGVHHTIYDGYGTLTINGYTMSNVVRVKTMDSTLYSNTGPTLTYSANNYTEVYNWYQPNNPDILLSIQITTGDLMNSTVVNVSTAMITGIENVTSKSQMEISVKPSLVGNENSYLLIQTAKPQNGLVEIYNTVGQLVSARNFETNIGMNTIELQTSNLDKGLYLVRVKEANGKVTAAQKLVVQ